MMRKLQRRRKPEPTIALINIVFLMLIFFMVAGVLAPPLDPELSLVETKALEGREPPNALVLDTEGNLRFRGDDVEGVDTYMSTLGDDKIARLVPDRAAPALALIEIAKTLRAAGAEKVMIVTENALQ